MSYLEDIESASEFEATREKLQSLLEQDEALYMKFMDLFVELMNFRYVSNKNWMGISNCETS